MNPQKGFTLIEVLAAGAISTIVAGATLAVFSITTNQIGESAANANLGLIQSIVSEQIRRDTRFAYGPKSPDEDLTVEFVDKKNNPAILNQKTVYLCDLDGIPFRAYRINEGHLEEWDDDDAFVKFKIGNQLVAVDEANSHFDILAGRSGIRFQIASRVVSDKVYTFPLIAETVLVRNGN